MSHSRLVRRLPWLHRLVEDATGTAAVQVAIVAPVMLAATFGVAQLAIVVFDIHRAGEATRSGARTALFNEPIAALDNLPVQSVFCEAGEDPDVQTQIAVTCTGGAVQKEETFIEIFDAMRNVIPDLTPENVTVTYTASGLESVDQPGVLIPQIEITLRDFEADLVLAQLLGLPDTITLPSVGASRLASSMVP